MFRGRFLLTVTIRLLLISSLTLGQTNHPTEIVEGSWTDVCPCDIPCTCWKTYKSTTDRCVNFHIFRVDRGAYESADLAGAIFIVMSIPSTPYESPVSRDLVRRQVAQPQENYGHPTLSRELLSPRPTH